MAERRVGDDMLVFFMFIWLTIAVGPWWSGMVLFALCGWLNWMEKRAAARASGEGAENG